MARQGDLNKSFWVKLRGACEVDDRMIVDIINRNVEMTKTVIDEKTPELFGGLKFSSYAVVEQTTHGYAGRVGYTNEPHINLNPSDPHKDDFTNRELMEMLSNMAATSSDVLDIMDELADVGNRINAEIAEYWKSKGR